MKAYEKSVCAIVQGIDKRDTKQLFKTLCENCHHDSQDLLELLFVIYVMLEEFTCSSCSSGKDAKAVIRSTFHFGHDEQLHQIIIAIRFVAQLNPRNGFPKFVFVDT
uniref:Uncharacterized protein n=1 Tax=Romanomermis culicivorax TaxID=13658 RepID=A0A915JS55_ROMCU